MFLNVYISYSEIIELSIHTNSHMSNLILIWYLGINRHLVYTFNFALSVCVYRHN